MLGCVITTPLPAVHRAATGAHRPTGSHAPSSQNQSTDSDTVMTPPRGTAATQLEYANSNAQTGPPHTKINTKNIIGPPRTMNQNSALLTLDICRVAAVPQPSPPDAGADATRRDAARRALSARVRPTTQGNAVNHYRVARASGAVHAGSRRYLVS